MNTPAVSSRTRSRSRSGSGRPATRRRLTFGTGTTGIIGPQRSLARNTAKTTPGFPLAGKTAKTHTTFRNIDTLTVYSVDALLIDDIAKGDQINRRERDIVNLAGWKVRLQVHNTWDLPVTFRFAVVSPRQTFGANPTERNQNLLRSFGPERSLNLGLGNSGITNTNNKINDDLYMVLYETSIELGPDAGATGYSGGIQKNWHYMDKWIPLKKQFRYNVGTGGKSETPVYIIYWFDSKIRKAAELFSDIGGAGFVATRTDAIAYFHDRE